MPKLLRRGKTPARAPEVDHAAQAEPAVEERPAVEAEPQPQPEPAPPPVTAGDSRPAGNGNKGSTSPGGPGGLIGRLYGDPGEVSREERDRQAALEFEQAVAPVMDLLKASVPEASSPDEAARAWESRVGELRPDPGAGAYVPGDRFDREARVYYRLLRRDYEKNPRPSMARKRSVSHHLHSQYNRFPGTKGW